MSLRISAMLFLAGAVALLRGVYLISVPAGHIALGLVLATVAMLPHRGSR